jgi:hypothetical protein
MSNQPLIEFDIKLSGLSKNQREVLALLVDAAKLIAPLYLEQEEELRLEDTSKVDPRKQSAYVVQEKQKGKVVEVPYHVKYADFLIPIAEKLKNAAKRTENKEFGRFLRLQAKALLDGSYEEAIEASLSLKPYVLDISIGPVRHLDDELFYGKASYQAWVGILDKEGTDRFNDYKSIILGARRKALMPSERIEVRERVKGKVLDAVVFSGLMARTMFVGVNMPMETMLVEKYGSEITLFNQPNDMRLKEQIMPSFNKIFSKQLRAGFENEDLRRGYLRAVAMHELAHSFLYYRHSVENLQKLFQIIYELAATVLGIRMAGSLLLMDRITSKQLESMIVTLISRSYYNLEKRTEYKSMINYSVGGTILINYLLESGALKENRDVFVPNFMKIFMALHDLSDTLEHLLSSGTKADAEKFVNKYSK